MPSVVCFAPDEQIKEPLWVLNRTNFFIYLFIFKVHALNVRATTLNYGSFDSFPLASQVQQMRL